MSNKVVFVVDIDVRNSPKVRAGMNEAAIADYTAIYKEDKKKLPPIVLFTEDNHHHLLADGAHRLAAQVAMKVKTVMAEVRRGGYADALAFALTANERHGLRRSPADKRQCVTAAIKQWPGLPNIQIAQRCAVNDHLVKDVRTEMEAAAEVKPEAVRVDTLGRPQPASKKQPAVREPERETKKEAPTEKKPTDITGRVIPAFCITCWNRTDEIKELLQHVSHVISALKQANRDSDIMFAGVNLTGTIADLDKSWTSIQTAIPYVICTQCQGHPNKQPKGECRLCKNKGLISKFLWDTVVPSEVKAVLKSQAK